MVFTQAKLVRVRVEATDLTEEEQLEHLTNEFHFIFKVDKDVP